MRLENLISHQTKQRLFEVSAVNSMTRNDLQRVEVKGKYYAENIVMIRHMTKFKLLQFISDKRKEPGIKLAYNVIKTCKITHSSMMYRLLDDKVKQDIELINYARNRLKFHYGTK